MVYGNLSRLSDLAYSHRYFVDGTPAVADAVVNSNWATVLVGGLGGGGQGVFALDVTDPTAVTEASASTKVLWEFSDRDDPDLGYTYGQPQIVKLANDKWAVLIGNGYNNSEADGYASSTGRASLFILFLDRTRVAHLDAGHRLHQAADQCGVGRIAQRARQRVPGRRRLRRQGRLCLRRRPAGQPVEVRPDVDAPSCGALPRAACRCSRRSTSGTAQPITASVEVMKNPYGGFMVLFGTGIYLQPSDPSAPTSARASRHLGQERRLDGEFAVLLQQQTVRARSRPVAASTASLRTTSSTGRASAAGTWTSRPTGRAPRPASGSSPAADPLRARLPTLIPSTSPCDKGGTSWLMELDALTGSRLDSSPFDVNNDACSPRPTW